MESAYFRDVEMNDPAQIQGIARERLEEASILAANGKCDGAFYLAGYAVELTLKAKICIHCGIPNLFGGSSPADGLGKHGGSELRKIVKTHNLYTLLALCGLKSKYDEERAVNKAIMKVGSLLFGHWDENVRYQPCGELAAEDVADMITLMQGPDGFLSWIEKS